ncbi:MAG: hypothetical protein AB2747_17570 [Candidatus Thiodiazotropha taylori]|nr:hypothetical protein [Candidatus Thiodiazotropha taylori]MCW4276910.1 hypothetical protein [Candidatus Thiodiazotropha taylori]
MGKAFLLHRHFRSRIEEDSDSDHVKEEDTKWTQWQLHSIIQIMQRSENAFIQLD